MDVHVYLSQEWRARALQRLPYLKHNNVPKWRSRFALGPNAVKNNNYIVERFE